MNRQCERGKPQRILVFQQKRSGENKIRGIRRHGGDCFLVETFNIDSPLPVLIEDSGSYLPETIEADLVLDYLKHPDLSGDLWRLCEKLGIPVVASNKKGAGKWALTPRTCCALARSESLGEYGRLFGAPEFEVTVTDGRISEISVARGAPCGATWEAAVQTLGVGVESAPVHIGLRTQYLCTADPAGWDVMNGRSPVHIAAELHGTALEKAIGCAGTGE